MNRLAAAAQLRKALQMFAATLTEEKALEVPSVFPVWGPDRKYSQGDVFSYGLNNVGDPQLFRVNQDHTSRDVWPPNEAASLYTAFGVDGSGYAYWEQPSGAHDCYNSGDIVNHKDLLYISMIDGNTTEPGTGPYWELMEG